MKDNFTCPYCRRKLPFRYTLSMHIALNKPFPCPLCGERIAEEKSAIPSKVAFLLGSFIGLIAVFIFLTFGDKSMSSYIIYSVVVIVVALLLACIYTYYKTRFKKA